MSHVDEQGEQGGDDLVAAEYVLGVLSAPEREAAARRVDADRAFAQIVDAWEARLAPLAAAYLEEAPPASVKAAIDRRLFASASDVARRGKTGIWSSLAFWRALSAAGVAAALLLAVQPLMQRPADLTQDRLVASLDAQNSDVRYLALYDRAADRVSLSHVSGERATNRDFELWMIEGQNAPVSVGVVPSGNTITLQLTDDLRAKLAAGAVLAISVEPTGGSPTGQPTGPVVAAGGLRDI